MSLGFHNSLLLLSKLSQNLPFRLSARYPYSKSSTCSLKVKPQYLSCLLSPSALPSSSVTLPLPQTRAKYGGYGGVFKALLGAAAKAISHPGISSTSGLSLTNWDVVVAQSYPDLAEIDAILIIGSRYNSFDNTPWIVQLVEFTKKVLAQSRVRIIGVCFGHKIVGRAMGVRVGRSSGSWEASVTAIDLTKKGQEIFGRNAVALHQMHRDDVYEYPPGTESLAYTAGCAVQGMYVPKRLITVQGHPEFDEEIVRELLIARHELGVFDDEIYHDAMSRVDKYQDGVLTAVAFLKLLLED